MQVHTALRKMFSAKYTAIRKMFFAEYTAIRKMFGYYLTDKTIFAHKKAMQKQPFISASLCITPHCYTAGDMRFTISL